MSSGYRALLQSLDETESEVARGLGGPIRIKKRSGCCCQNWLMWSCFATFLVIGVSLSVGVPILLTLPVDSVYHWSNWLPKTWFVSGHSNSTVESNDTLVEDFTEDPSSNEVEQMNSTGWTMPVLGKPGSHQGSMLQPPAEVSNNATTVLQEAIHQLHKMTEWMKEQYDKTPKVPLIVALCVFLLAILTVVWFVVYRKIKRRQRRRALGKLVTDLQSGKTLLNSDDSEDD